MDNRKEEKPEFLRKDAYKDKVRFAWVQGFSWGLLAGVLFMALLFYLTMMGWL